MNNIYYGSDLHLEFEKGKNHSVKIPCGKVLILAGDTCTPNNISSNNQYLLFKDFFKEISEKFEKIIMILGNHCYYSGFFEDTYQKVKEFVVEFPNIHILQNEYLEIDDVILYGTTLWTDLKNSDPLVIHDVKRELNDYGYIKRKNISNIRSYKNQTKLLPNDTVYENKLATLKLEDFINSYDKNKKLIIISHHQPVYFREDRTRNLTSYGYYNTQLDNIVLDNELIWVAGHIHRRIIRKLEKSFILTNARGYINYEKMSETFEFKTISESIIYKGL